MTATTRFAWAWFIGLSAAALLLAGCVGIPDDDDILAPADDDDDDNDDDASPAPSDAAAGLARAVDYLLGAQDPEGWWMGSFVTDASFTADYILLRQYLRRVDAGRQQMAVNYILAQQQPDGGWNAYPGGPSVLEISAEAYFALKLTGVAADEPAMQRARDFVLAHGGAEQTNTLVKTKLALFGQVPWRSMIPLNTNVVGIGNLVYHLGYFHSVLIPFTLIYENHHVVHPAAGRGAPEMFVSDPWAGVNERPPRKGCCAPKALDWLRERQEADGNWAGVFINTMFSLIALQSTGDPAYDELIERGLAGVDLFQNIDGDTMNQQFSQPPVMDSAYVLHLLLSAGLDPDSPEMSLAAEWLRSKQTTIAGDWSVLNPEGEPGGWSFEHYNRYFPDIDCAVMVLDAFSRLDGDAREAAAGAMQRGVNWVVSMQNADGGWAAWDKNALNIKEVLPFLHDALWLPVDVSWADVTARVLLALADLGYPGEFGDPWAIPQGLAFLKSQQTAVGAWYGRWGVNYTYGTGQVLQTLAALGEAPDLPYVRRAIDWLESVQNADGGWGEDPTSYLDPAQAGVGESTVFQTAYALIGLIAMGEAATPGVERGVRWLLDAQQADGSWFDERFLGCNLPGYWYSRYDLLSTYKAAYALLAYDRAAGGI